MHKCYFLQNNSPATPTVAAPAPINLAAASISLAAKVVWNGLTKKGLVMGTRACDEV